MAVILEGSCRVSDYKEGTPLAYGALSIWPQVGRAVGAQAISLSTWEFAPGLSPGLRSWESDAILYVLSGKATVFFDGWPFKVSAETGLYVRPGLVLTVDNPGPEPLAIVTSQCPEPRGPAAAGPPLTAPLTDTLPFNPLPLVQLADRPAVPTADRWYRVLIDYEAGSRQVTQFIGSIPPGRAPDHFHAYEEVLFILCGTGNMWAGENHTPIQAHSCVYLPKGQVHCVENTGRDELRLLGVFYPAGSPGARGER